MFKEMRRYIIFGILTTITNIVIYVVLTKVAFVDYKLATTIAWLVSILFAFITNKLYVFDSKTLAVLVILKEFSVFFIFRLVSYGLDIGMMIILVDVVGTDDLFSKLVTNFFVILFNYAASKRIIFVSQEIR